MGKRVIVFGDEEKHTLEIDWSRWNGVATITIDGQKKKDVWFQNLGPMMPGSGSTHSYDFSVGTKDIHSVHVEIGYALFNPSTTIIVDGNVMQ